MKLNWSQSITYDGMLALLDDRILHLHVRAFASFQFKTYIENEAKESKSDVIYLLLETGYKKNTRQFEISGKKIFKRIEQDAEKHKIEFAEYLRQFHVVMLEKIMQSTLSDFYEIIKNYKDHKNLNLIRELNKEDWFRMLTILRNHFSHFLNMGKHIKFPDSLPFKHLKQVSWNGKTIKAGQLGETIPFSFEYISELINYGIQFLKDNKGTLE